MNRHVQYGRYICSGPYAKNVKCIYTSAPGHTVDCNAFIWGAYSDIFVSHLDINNFHVWHLRHIVISGTQMAKMCEVDIAIDCHLLLHYIQQTAYFFRCVNTFLLLTMFVVLCSSIPVFNSMVMEYMSLSPT